MSLCIEWQGARHGKGYGLRRHLGKMVRVHRLAWEEAFGPIPDGMLVLHRCDNPPCYNVEHLFLGTNSDNQQDAVRKNRRYGGAEFCGKGHSDWKRTPMGRRYCRVCASRKRQTAEPV